MHPTTAPIEQLVEGFQQYAMTEMLIDWIRCQAKPQKAVNDLIFAWRDSMRANFKRQRDAYARRTGVIDVAGSADEDLLREAEAVIRKRLEAALRTEPDGQLVDSPDPDKTETPNAPN